MGERWPGLLNMPVPFDGYHELATWRGFIARLSTLRESASTLNRPATFEVMTATSSDETVATATIDRASAGCSGSCRIDGKPIAGEHVLVVEHAAQARKLITTSFQAGASGLGLSGIFRLNSRAIAVFPIDSLNDIAVKIMRSRANVRAQVVHLGPSDFRMILTANETGADGAMEVDEEGGGSLAESLGLLAKDAQLTPGRDARFTVDGVLYSSPDNTIAGLIDGVIVSIGPPAKSASVTIRIDKDTSRAAAAVAEFADAYNAAVSQARSEEAMSMVARAIVDAAKGLDLSSAGLSVSSDGMLALDSERLDQALLDDPDAVYRAFALSVDCDHPDIAFLGASAKTRVSPPEGYAVAITRPASVTRVTATIAQSKPSAAEERLTFTGVLFPVPVKITLPAGNSLEDTVARINSSMRLRGRVTASVDEGGCLQLTSRHGSSGVFAVSSDLPASAESSGIGDRPIVEEGCDVAGTIDGEPADGDGRTLTGRPGNTNAEALRIIAAAVVAGDYGHVHVSRGIADRVILAIGDVLDAGQGGARGADLSAQIDDTEQEIARMNEQLDAFGEYLEQTVSAMDLRVLRLREHVDALGRRQ